ncbi:MAG: response regulator [Burkholderiaceae bacterium]
MITAVVLAPSILVVDPRAAARLHTAGLIRNRWPDARVNEADSGESALAEAADTDADLVIVDLPGQAGLDHARRLRQARPACQVALVAEPGTAASRALADRAGVRLFRAPVDGQVIEQMLSLVGWSD